MVSCLSVSCNASATPEKTPFPLLLTHPPFFPSSNVIGPVTKLDCSLAATTSTHHFRKSDCIVVYFPAPLGTHHVTALDE